MGKYFYAWSAGPMVWVDGHWLGSQKPCSLILTQGQVECKYCRDKVREKSMGYLPLYDKDLRQIVVGVGVDYQTVAERLNLHEPVKISKGRRDNDPVVVQRHVWTEMRCFVSGRQMNPIDLEPWCLNLWKWPELTEWFRANPSTPASDKPVVDPNAEYDRLTREAGDRERKAAAALLKKRLQYPTMEVKEPINQAKGQEAKQRNGTH